MDELVRTINEKPDGSGEHEDDSIEPMKVSVKSAEKKWPTV